jgi:hypothetical protein
MTTSLTPKSWIVGTSIAIAVAMVFAVVLAGAVLAFPASTPPSSSHLTLDSGAPVQWAFGGSDTYRYSCSNSVCFNGSTPPATISSLSLSISYNIQWVVIYTETNVTSTQTLIEGQAAASASVSASVSECIVETLSAPCTSFSLSGNVAGKVMALGFTNVTSAGSVYLTAGVGAPAEVSALAIMNAASNESFNFSGSFNGNIPDSGSSQSASASFDIGATEASSVNFATPLGIVPIDPVPGDSWNSSAPFSASGAFWSGYSYSEHYNGTSASLSNYNHTAVSPSGTLSVNGTDLGAFTLYDNYTNPPTTATAQEILLSFGDGEFAASNGWVMTPTGIFSGLDGLALLHESSPGMHAAAHSSTSIVSIASSESAYYEQGHGFVGASETGNASALGSIGSGVSGPKLNLQAGPEPVSVAESQYQGITNPSSSSGYPWTTIIIVVVVLLVVVIVVGAVMMRRRRPPTGAPPTGPTPPNTWGSSMPPPPPPTS